MPATNATPAGRPVRRASVKLAALAATLVIAPALPLGAAVVDFGDVNLSTPPAIAYTGSGGGVYYNGSDGAGSFTSGGASFGSNFSGGYWDGFAYSTTGDTTTAGYSNQYSAYSSGNSGAYAVAYPGFATPATISFATDVTLVSVDLTNTTYAFDSLLNGDGFGKKFGGASGDDADWFTVTFTGYDAFDVVTGTVTFYLADYRFSNNAEDYIVADWTTVNLSGLGTGVRSIELSWASSDTSVFGGETYINTPTYVALDNLVYSAVPEPSAFATVLGLAALGVGGLRRRARRS